MSSFRFQKKYLIFLMNIRTKGLDFCQTVKIKKIVAKVFFMIFLLNCCEEIMLFCEYYNDG
jgi:hypothetical protein